MTIAYAQLLTGYKRENSSVLYSSKPSARSLASVQFSVQISSQCIFQWDYLTNHNAMNIDINLQRGRFGANRADIGDGVISGEIDLNFHGLLSKLILPQETLYCTDLTN